MKNGRVWKTAILCILTAFALYVEMNLLMFLKMDWARSRAQEWPRYLESLSLFWIEACFAAAWTQLLVVCVYGCIRQFRKQPITKPLPPGTWQRLFWGGAVLLVSLLLAAHWIAPAYIAANAAQEDSAAGYAGVFYPLVIGAELVSGFLLWLLWDRLRVWSQKGRTIPDIEKDGEREYE